jgi:formylglycine-generating enzyme required for sulfatase activity
MKNTITLMFICTAILFNSCVEEPPNALITGVGGVVTDVNNNTLEGVEVSVGSKKELTDAKGYYMIDGVSGSSITLIATKVGYAQSNNSITIIGGEIKEQNIMLINLGSIEGKVTGNDGIGIDGVKIGTIPVTQEVYTDVSGNYILPDLQAGSYTISAEKVSYYTSSGIVTVTDGEITTKDITLLVEGEVPENFILVEGGTFQMGSTSGVSDELPMHSVTVNSFFISKYEITHAEYIDFMNTIGVSSNGSYGGGEYIDMGEADCAIGHDGNSFYFKGSSYASTENTPVIEVSWYGAKAFAEWAGGRLLTEAEWEYAARGGIQSQGYIYSGSNTIGDVTWYRSNSGSQTHDVGTKQPNELGIYDMSGNVLEWCSDWYDAIYYSISPNTNPKGPASGGYRVLRGGSWSYSVNGCRVAAREDGNPALTGSKVGFRYAKGL